MKPFPKNSIFLFLLLLLGFQNCKNDTKSVVIPGFYYWKTNVEINKAKAEYLRQLEVRQLYIKFFDIDWQQNEAIPLAEVRFYTPMETEGVQIIPTIFITNRTFQHVTNEKEITLLAAHVVEKIKTIAGDNSLHLREIQFDCDWSESTRDNYFLFLEKIRQAIPVITLSATIRLHQVKYYKRTGVPPVNKGVLMFYNMGNLEDVKEPNSILNLEKAKQYIAGLNNYPIHLDLALPLFSWGIIFREDKLIKLINGLDEPALADTVRFEKKAANWFDIKKSTYLQGYYLYKGDKIKLEEVGQPQLMESAQLLKKYFDDDTTHIIFYHLDQKIINNHSYENIKKILDVF